MRCELRVYDIARNEQARRTSQVRDIRTDLSGVDRIAGQSTLLCTFDFAIPIRAFDQAHGNATTHAACEFDHPLDDVGRTFTVCLHCQSKTRPLQRRRIAHQGLDDVEGNIQSIGFFCIERESDTKLCCAPGKLQRTRRQAHMNSIALEQ